jgi:hypothetical protein
MSFTFAPLDPDLTPEPAAGTGTVTPEPAAGTGAAPGETTCTGTVAVPAFPVPAQRIGWAESLRLAARERAALIADHQRRHRTFWHAVAVLITRPPETWAETEQHLKSRKWLQDWMTGRFRTFCEWENVAWYHLVARPGRTVLRLAQKVFFDRQLGFWAAVIFIGLCVLVKVL